MKLVVALFRLFTKTVVNVVYEMLAGRPAFGGDTEDSRYDD